MTSKWDNLHYHIFVSISQSIWLSKLNLFFCPWIQICAKTYEKKTRQKVSHMSNSHTFRHLSLTFRATPHCHAAPEAGSRHQNRTVPLGWYKSFFFRMLFLPRKTHTSASQQRKGSALDLAEASSFVLRKRSRTANMCGGEKVASSKKSSHSE